MNQAFYENFDRNVGSIITYIKADMVRDESIEINSETPLISSGLIDSLSLVEFVMHLEECLQMEIPLMKMEVEHFETLTTLRSKLSTL